MLPDTVSKQEHEAALLVEKDKAEVAKAEVAKLRQVAAQSSQAYSPVDLYRGMKNVTMPRPHMTL